MNSQPTFRDELEQLINKHSLENKSDTSDFLLADYLISCLAAFNETVRARETWHGRIPGRKNPA